MAWQLTGVLHRAEGLLRLGRPGDDAGAGDDGGAADPALLRAAQVRGGLRPDERAAYDGWVADRPEAGLVLARTLAATGRLLPVGELAAAWDGWDRGTQATVADPAHHLADAARQVDETTCGSAALALLLATGDPWLAAWLATGRLATHRPPELSGASPRALEVLGDADVPARVGVLQRVLLHRTGTAGPLRWPTSLGTPPWGAARVARYPGVRYTHRLLDDTDPGHLRVLDAVAGWVRRGVPTLLYAGGDSDGGWTQLVPRHVVLVVGAHDAATGPSLEVFEPASGALHRLPVASSGFRPALGGWNHLAWAVLPR